MKILLIVMGFIVAAIALVLICGVLLPEKHVASRQTRYRQKPDAIWGAIMSDQGDPTLTYKIEESDPPVHLVRRVIDPHHNFGGTWTYQIQPAADGAILRITENGEVYNPIFRFVSRFIMGYTGTIDTTLKALGTKFNEQVQIED
jgi:hypothetical protein